MMKFRVLRYADTCEVVIQIQTSDGSIDFVLDLEQEAVAGMVRNAIEDGMEDRIKAIREMAYKRGKKAARNSEHAINNFSGCLNSDWIGGWRL